MILHRSRFSGLTARGFTLIELLVVVAIIGIMLALILPSFRGFGRSANMRSSVAQIRSTMSLARQNAITKRQVTWVVFADTNTAASSPGEAWMANRSYAVWVTLNSGIGGASGIYLKAWTALPPGVVIAPDSTGWPGTGHGDNVLAAGLSNNIPFPTATNALRPVKVLQFTSEGAVNTNGREVYLTEAATETNGTMTIKAGALRFGVEAFQLTGQVRVRDYNL